MALSALELSELRKLTITESEHRPQQEAAQVLVGHEYAKVDDDGRLRITEKGRKYLRDLDIRLRR